jgi:transcriptional regulator with XRE-family HTH domain
MSSADLIRTVKYKAQIDRDSDLAQRLGVGRASVSAWLKGISNPDGIAMLKLAVLAGISAEDALKIVTYTTANDDTASTLSADKLYIM